MSDLQTAISEIRRKELILQKAREILSEETPVSEEVPKDEAYWNAQIKELRYRVLAGELWETKKVYDVLSSTFKALSGAKMNMVSELLDSHDFSENQKQAITRHLDAMFTQAREAFIASAGKNESLSVLGDLS